LLSSRIQEPVWTQGNRATSTRPRQRQEYPSGQRVLPVPYTQCTMGRGLFRTTFFFSLPSMRASRCLSILLPLLLVKLGNARSGHADCCGCGHAVLPVALAMAARAKSRMFCPCIPGTPFMFNPFPIAVKSRSITAAAVNRALHASSSSGALVTSWASGSR